MKPNSEVPQSYTNNSNGLRRSDLATISQLARVTNTTPDFAFGGSDIGLRFPTSVFLA